jgi:hypothetical protein
MREDNTRRHQARQSQDCRTNALYMYFNSHPLFRSLYHSLALSLSLSTYLFVFVCQVRIRVRVKVKKETKKTSQKARIEQDVVKHYPVYCFYEDMCAWSRGISTLQIILCKFQPPPSTPLRSWSWSCSCPCLSLSLFCFCLFLFCLCLCPSLLLSLPPPPFVYHHAPCPGASSQGK